MPAKSALITGITGQDGSYLAEFLLDKGYQVHGVKRRTSLFNTARIDHLFDRDDFHLHHGDMTDTSSLLHIVEKTRPVEIYNLAAQSHVAVSFEEPEYTADADAVGALRLLEVVRTLDKSIRYYQAATSELYGNNPHPVQNEDSPFLPESPYGAAKCYAYWICSIYRKAYGLFACNGILFNHESPRRGETFSTRKITHGLARVKLGLQDFLLLGNLDAKRDWGHARDYVEAQYLMLQQEKPLDYVIATGEQRSVREFVEAAATRMDIAIEWRGKGVDEVGIDGDSGREIVKVDPRYFRPAEVDALCGDPSKARRELGWEPKTTFDELVDEMVESDLEQARRARLLCGKKTD